MWLALLACVVLTLNVARGYTLCLDAGGRAALENAGHTPHSVHATVGAALPEGQDVLAPRADTRCFDVGLVEVAKQEREQAADALVAAPEDILPFVLNGILQIGAALQARASFPSLQPTDVDPRTSERRSVVLLI